MGLGTGNSGKLRAKPAAPARSAVAPLPLDDFDTQLMLLVREGDADAASQLIRRNFGRVSRYVSRIVRDPRAVEDLTQDVFVQVLTHAPEFEPRAKLSTWLFRIATNRALNHARKTQFRRAALGAIDSRASGRLDASDAGPEGRMDLDEIRRRVTAAVSDLPANQKAALALFEYEGMSYEQIAAVLEVSVEAVRCLLSRARGTLRARLAGLV